MRSRLGTALHAGLLAWFGIYTLELLWTLKVHPSAWARAYLAGPLPSVIVLYGLAGAITALAVLPLIGRARDARLETALRVAAGVILAYLAVWAVNRYAAPGALGWKSVLGSLLAMAAAVAIARRGRLLLGRRFAVAATAIVALAVAGTLAAHARLSRGGGMGTPGVAAPPGAPDVLLLTIDTLRARSLGCYGHARARTPHIDRLAAEGTRWKHFYTPVPQTGPSFASILSGLHPARHGLLQNGWRLDGAVATLPERLARAGWETLGVVSVAHLGSAYGFSQGFGDYGNQNPVFDGFYLYSSSTGARFSLVDLLRRIDLAGLEESPWNPASRSRRGDLTMDEVLRRLRERGGERPLFLWLHLFDPHLPYTPPQRLREGFKRTDLALPPSPMPPEEIRERFDGYDGEVAFVDEQVGRLLEALGPRLDRTLVVFVSDHGEALGEHGYVAHANHVSEEIIEVPFFLRWPGRVSAGRVETRRGHTMDVAPTILDLLELPPMEGVDGRSLLHPGREKPLFLMTDNPSGRQIRGILDGARKMLLTAAGGFGGEGWEGAERELYDLEQDPGELYNLAPDEPVLTQTMSDGTRAFFAMTGIKPQEIDPDTRNTLRSLGYLD
jgi:arylsulfatase A-like enzyme